jgi:hypothetical protein
MRRITEDEIIAQFHAACEGHDLQGRMPTYSQISVWTGSVTLANRIRHRFGTEVFARKMGLNRNNMEAKEPQTSKPRRVWKWNPKVCNGCQWIRDGQEYCVLPKCMRGVNVDDKERAEPVILSQA